MIIGVGVKKRVSVNYTLTKIQMKKEARVLVNQKIFGIGQDKQGYKKVIQSWSALFKWISFSQRLLPADRPDFEE